MQEQGGDSQVQSGVLGTRSLTPSQGPCPTFLYDPGTGSSICRF